MTTGEVTIAALALPNRRWDISGNLARLRPWVAKAADQGADLVVCPEAYLDGYCLHDFYETPPTAADLARYRDAALEWPSAAPLQELASLGRDCIACIWCAAASSASATALYNTAFIFGPDGPVGRYHKTHIGWETSRPYPGRHDARLRHAVGQASASSSASTASSPRRCAPSPSGSRRCHRALQRHVPRHQRHMLRRVPTRTPPICAFAHPLDGSSSRLEAACSAANEEPAARR